jgi:hypothetical protein
MRKPTVVVEWSGIPLNPCILRIVDAGDAAFGPLGAAARLPGKPFSHFGSAAQALAWARRNRFALAGD